MIVTATTVGARAEGTACGTRALATTRTAVVDTRARRTVFATTVIATRAAIVEARTILARAATALEARRAIGAAKTTAFTGAVLTAATFARTARTRAVLARTALRCTTEIVAPRAGPPLETRRAVGTAKTAAFTRAALTRAILARTATLRCAPEIIAPLEARRAIGTAKAAAALTRAWTGSILAWAALARAATRIIAAWAAPAFEARCARRAALAVTVGSGRTGGAITAATGFAWATTRTATRRTGSGCRRCRLGVDAQGGTRAGARRAGGRWGRRHLPLLSPPCPAAAEYHTLCNVHDGVNQHPPSAADVSRDKLRGN